MDALELVAAAQSLGFDRCGIIPVARMSGYEARLEERMAHFPQTRRHYEPFRGFAHLSDRYPWAKSVVVCSFWYGKYRIPAALQGRIAKYYLTDGRRDAASQGFRTSVSFENALRGGGLRTATDRDFGITALRWAAMQAGLGIIRKNNFFYTEKGSYQYLEAFLIDAPLEYIAGSRLRPCADQCDLCRRACPTGSLEAPYLMCRNTCVSCLTTWDGWDLRAEPLRDRFGAWIYGCDACQDACPYNRNAWKAEQEFPGLEELSGRLTDEEIVLAGYDWLKSVLQPKLWYIPQEKAWRYKTNALNAMLNHYTESCLPVIQKACLDECAEVRDMARWVLARIPTGKQAASAAQTPV